MKNADGVKFLPFRPFIYAGGADKSDFIAPPYDIISPSMKRALYRKNPYNVVRLILGRKYPADSERRNCYTRAAAYFEKWRTTGVLEEGEEAVYILEQRFVWEGREYKRTGAVARLDWSQTDPARILPHEKTFRKHREDRRALLRKISYNFSPVFLLAEGIEKTLEKALEYSGETAYYGSDGEKGVLYALRGEAARKITAVFKRKFFVIADGHHRLKVSRDNYMARRAEKYALVYVTDFLSGGCLILSHGDRKTRIPASAIRKVIKEKKLMGQKTTFFWPKLPSGLLIHPIK